MFPKVLKFVVCHADAVEARVTVAIAASKIFFIVSLLSLSLFVLLIKRRMGSENYSELFKFFLI